MTLVEQLVDQLICESTEAKFSVLPEQDEDFRAAIEAEYPLAGNEVGGLRVRSGQVPNTDSIAASLTDYEVLPGIREVSLEGWNLTGKTYSVSGNKRIQELEAAIEASGEITPLIVGVDADGPYIIEGSTRIEALYNLGVKSFPAMVVLEK